MLKIVKEYTNDKVYINIRHPLNKVKILFMNRKLMITYHLHYKDILLKKLSENQKISSILRKVT
jgi:hypothetical protein